MKDFLDRTPTIAGLRKLIYMDGTSVYAKVEMADEPTEEGTPLNREAFMALQGFEKKQTVFNADGSITETNELGETKITTFNSDGSISEVFTNKDGLQIGKKTLFNSDGSIQEDFIDFST